MQEKHIYFSLAAFPLTIRIYLFVYYSSASTSYIVLPMFCVFFYSAHLLMEPIPLLRERRSGPRSDSSSCLGYVREWVSVGEPTSALCEKPASRLLPSTRNRDGERRAQKQTNFSIKRWGGSLFLFYLFSFFISDISYHVADGTTPSLQIWEKTIYGS